jgi:hypothetical protein
VTTLAICSESQLTGSVCPDRDTQLAAKEFILDTSGVLEYCRNASVRAVYFLRTPQPAIKPTPCAQWTADLLKQQEHAETISRVSARLPGSPESYRLQAHVRESLVYRLCHSLGMATNMQSLAEVWIGEMERFLCLKAYKRDTHATKLSPSGDVCAVCTHSNVRCWHTCLHQS